ncbi:hypothetical protein AVEN_66233-1 [Araneus ventricosus]|uniref:Uncharacterized protein n=1 Tax=Araneus ventricosus TaxID=182803 RepID=A0A4Y2I660_ARAVE|nr:hypothetical protein AVEN_66233-1 [Araneus ventricosus]
MTCRDGPVVKSQLRDLGVPCSKPYSGNQPSYMWFLVTLIMPWRVKHPPSGVAEACGGRCWMMPRNLPAVQNYKIRPKRALVLLHNGS